MYLLDLAYKKTIRDMPGLNDQKRYVLGRCLLGEVQLGIGREIYRDFPFF